jgi:hypothetical protein
VAAAVGNEAPGKGEGADRRTEVFELALGRVADTPRALTLTGEGADVDAGRAVTLTERCVIVPCLPKPPIPISLFSFRAESEFGVALPFAAPLSLAVIFAKSDNDVCDVDPV